MLFDPQRDQPNGLHQSKSRRKLKAFKKAGWSWGCVSAVDSEGRTIWIADAHRGGGRRFVVHADERFTAFLELESAICVSLRTEQNLTVHFAHFSMLKVLDQIYVLLPLPPSPSPIN